MEDPDGSRDFALGTSQNFHKPGDATPVVLSPTRQSSLHIALLVLVTGLGRVEAERTKYSKRVRQLYVRDREGEGYFSTRNQLLGSNTLRRCAKCGHRFEQSPLTINWKSR